MSFLDAENSIVVVRGSSASFALTVTDPTTDVPIDLTGARLLLAVKGQEADRAPRIVKDSNTGGHWTVASPRSGVAVVNFAPADTHGMNPGAYVFDLWVVFGDGRRVPLIPLSDFHVHDSITRIPL